MKYYLTKIIIDYSKLASLMYVLPDEELDEAYFEDYNDDGEVNEFIDVALSNLKDDYEYYYADKYYSDKDGWEINILTNYDLLKSKKFRDSFTNEYVKLSDLECSVIELYDYKALKEMLIKGAEKDSVEYDDTFCASDSVLNNSVDN